MSALQLTDVSVVSSSGLRQLDGVTLELAPGEVLGIVGPNGAGKTTLLRAALGLTPLSAGSVDWHGRPLDTLRPRELARMAAYIPQGQVVHWPLSVRRTVELGRLPHTGGIVRDTDRSAVDAALAAVDAQSIADRRLDQLSGGERARVLLARALAVEAPVLLADEPVAALDAYHQLDLMERLRELARGGRAIAIVLHDLTLAARFCTRIAMLAEGRVVLTGAVHEVLSTSNLRTVYRVDALLGTHAGEPYVLPWRCSQPSGTEG
ncbi:MAG TPA: ABC transporter ATP-binding protein [Steroidobacteraceae bacterium]|nr:ABC transporter ATP-binding protein [Steroidobacteraceae bacterium]HRX88930.1 ABC transporter ATP-binding protein [Steroidobacteraceae bacterium]